MSAQPAADPLRLPAQVEASIRAAADEMDAIRDIPEELLAELRDAGAFRLFTPRELGGFEAPLTTALEVYERFGRIDASVAWIVWNANWGFIGALLGEAGTARLWEPGPEPVFANSGTPGVAVAVRGGYRVSGNWRLVSGIHGADRLIVAAVITEGDVPRLTQAGTPDVRLFILERGRLSVKDTWHATGLRGSGSNDVLVQDALVPDELVARVDVPARVQRPPYQGFIPGLVFPGCTAVVLGVAQAAIDATVELARSKKTLSGGTLAESSQAVIARSEAALQAARLLLHAAAEAMAGAATGDVMLERRAALRAAMSHGAQVSREVLVAMYELGGSSSVYRGRPVERLFRDGMVALQHANHSAAFFEVAGRVRFGMDPGVALF
ncbi:acyl-CoA dehydrogenase [Actinoallomurus liliacearum]|uniref:Acyl-CoA dehydrogenase n=1 Tax=Actinoallomurus liliacearum TaxID=1080073 RepID=A0ABP8TEI1_9ACTN